MSTVVVTGSASGIGRGIRERLTADGHTVVGVDLRDADVIGNLSTPDGRQGAIDAVRAIVGDSVDRVVACAGVGGSTTPLGLIARVNYFGAVATLAGLYPLLQKGDAPAAVAIGSNSASLVPPGDHPLVTACLAGEEAAAVEAAESIDGQSVYMQSKLALTRWCRGQVPEWGAAGVRLNVVMPGPVDTALLQQEMADPLAGPAIKEFPVPIGRWGTPADIAAAVAFLLDPGCWAHGSVLFVDGGTDALFRPDAL